MATVQETIQRLERIKSGINAARDSIAQSAAETMLDAKQSELDKTYNRPIPSRAQYGGKTPPKGTAKGKGTKASGAANKPAWKRSGALREDQAIVVTGDGKREVRNVGESAAYEGHLANLPTGRDGVNRSNDAATNAQRKGEARLPAIVAAELEKAVWA